MTFFPLAVMAVAPFSGALSDRLGSRVLASLGAAICALALVAIGFLPTVIAGDKMTQDRRKRVDLYVRHRRRCPRESQASYWVGGIRNELIGLLDSEAQGAGV